MFVRTMRIWMAAAVWVPSVPLAALPIGKPPEPPANEATLPVPELVARLRPSLVTISARGREKSAQSVGTGFVIDPTGLIATNLHVIGQGRPLSVQLVSGETLRVLSIYASEPHQDLAVLQVDAKVANLKALELAPPESLRAGMPVLALGHPHGLSSSVVSGIVSGIRALDGRQLIQLAIPVEPGNSGGPVVDSLGRVHGIVTMKSAVSDNLGFAVQSAALEVLLSRPNPIAIDRWLTIGMLDSKRWRPHLGGRWRQRGGKILVEGFGEGFGGRAICLWQPPPPEPPYEVAVFARLEDEDGAAGLVFHADGGDRHYGFYPSNGRLRLTCFRGATVFTWEVLQEKASPTYRKGEWNHLKVRVERDKLSCFVNDQLVIESRDQTFGSGQVGLAKFRHTRAQFKGFRIAKEIPPVLPDAAARKQILETLADLPSPAALTDKQLDPLAAAAAQSRAELERRATHMEREASRLRELAQLIHVRGIASRLQRLIEADPEGFDLLEAGLLIAALDDRDVDVDSYKRQVDRMADEILASLPKDANEASRLEALNQFLFVENGFHGSRFDYQNRANSYLNRVIDDREGLPITLSVLYIELGRRLGLSFEGVGMPGHFIVRFLPSEGDGRLLDVFDAARPLSREDASEKVRELVGVALLDSHLAPSSKREIATRILRNLLGNAQAREDRAAMLRYVEALLAIAPESVEYRGMRAMLRIEAGRRAAAVNDLDWILNREPEGLDLDRLQRMRDAVAGE